VQYKKERVEMPPANVVSFPAMTKPGNGDSGRIRDLPRLGVTIRPEVKRLLDTTAGHEGRAPWRVIEDAILAYFQALPKADKRTIQEALGGEAPAASDLVKTEYPASVSAAVRAFVRLWTEPKDRLEEATRTVLADALHVPPPE
jgi:hypothetical protein